MTSYHGTVKSESESDKIACKDAAFYFIFLSCPWGGGGKHTISNVSATNDGECCKMGIHCRNCPEVGHNCTTGIAPTLHC